MPYLLANSDYLEVVILSGPEAVPSLSIVIPTLDEAQALPRLLQQLGPARARGAEVIVVDGGSSDQTCALAESGGARVLTSGRGRARQLQAGCQAASGDVIWMLHADSEIDPYADQHIVWGVANSGRQWGRFAVRIDGASPLLRVIARAMNLRSRMTGIATGDQGIFVSRRLLNRIGGIPQLPLMEDVELSVRLREQCPPLCFAKRITTSGRRWTQHGALRTMLLMWRLRLGFALGEPTDVLARKYAASGPGRD